MLIVKYLNLFTITVESSVGRQYLNLKDGMYDGNLLMSN